MKKIFEKKGENDELMKRQKIEALKMIHESRMPMLCMAVIRPLISCSDCSEKGRREWA